MVSFAVSLVGELPNWIICAPSEPFVNNVTSCEGSSNPYNMVRATFDALKRQDSPRSVAARRNIKVSTLQARRRDLGEGEQATE